MKVLYDEVLRRFPEVAPRLSKGDKELPYVVVGSIVRWLLSVAKPTLPPEAAGRVVKFHQWCAEQPRGTSAADDIVTIEQVALIEDLFEHDELLPLVPKLMTRQQMTSGKEYLTTWVGAARYDAALSLFEKFRWERKSKVRKGRRRE